MAEECEPESCSTRLRRLASAESASAVPVARCRSVATCAGGHIEFNRDSGPDRGMDRTKSGDPIALKRAHGIWEKPRAWQTLHCSVATRAGCNLRLNMGTLHVIIPDSWRCRPDSIIYVVAVVGSAAFSIVGSLHYVALQAAAGAVFKPLSWAPAQH